MPSSANTVKKTTLNEIELMQPASVVQKDPVVFVAGAKVVHGADVVVFG